jgi:hypothetical protein
VELLAASGAACTVPASSADNSIIWPNTVRPIRGGLARVIALLRLLMGYFYYSASFNFLKHIAYQ